MMSLTSTAVFSQEYCLYVILCHSDFLDAVICKFQKKNTNVLVARSLLRQVGVITVYGYS